MEFTQVQNMTLVVQSNGSLISVDFISVDSQTISPSSIISQLSSQVQNVNGCPYAAGALVSEYLDPSFGVQTESIPSVTTGSFPDITAASSTTTSLTTLQVDQAGGTSSNQTNTVFLLALVIPLAAGLLLLVVLAVIFARRWSKRVALPKAEVPMVQLYRGSRRASQMPLVSSD